EGCDLSGVELLIQVSCSVGRVLQTDQRDAEGFCVELAVSRARSVIAALWPIHAAHAAFFATQIIDCFCRAREEGIPARSDVASSLRGRALNTVLRKWAKEYREQRAVVGLNTAAAFQLYGLA